MMMIVFGMAFPVAAVSLLQAGWRHLSLQMASVCWYMMRAWWLMVLLCGCFVIVFSLWNWGISNVCDAVCFIRCMWNRIFAVNLFIQHVCPPGTKDQLAVKKLMPLWHVSAMLLVLYWIPLLEIWPDLDLVVMFRNWYMAGAGFGENLF